MTTLIVRDLESVVVERLRVRAARGGRSIEEEVRVLLRVATGKDDKADFGLGSRIHADFARIGGVDLEIPRRER